MVDTIYVVTAGSYSDYGIVAMFSNKADAEDLRKEIADSNGVEEWPLDSVMVREGVFPFVVYTKGRTLEVGEIRSERGSSIHWKDGEERHRGTDVE